MFDKKKDKEETFKDVAEENQSEVVKKTEIKDRVRIPANNRILTPEPEPVKVPTPTELPSMSEMIASLHDMVADLRDIAITVYQEKSKEKKE